MQMQKISTSEYVQKDAKTRKYDVPTKNFKQFLTSNRYFLLSKAIELVPIIYLF
jgi:hypothetical protein